MPVCTIVIILHYLLLSVFIIIVFCFGCQSTHFSSIIRLFFLPEPAKLAISNPFHSLNYVTIISPYSISLFIHSLYTTVIIILMLSSIFPV